MEWIVVLIKKWQIQTTEEGVDVDDEMDDVPYLI
jgi:hypothetical protein